MHPTDPSAPPVPLVCQDCGATISTLDPLGGGLCQSCLWSDLSDPPPQDVSTYKDLVPDYEIIEEIGRGGMGVVFRAHQISTSRDVALKMLLPLASDQVELRARFQQEARTLAELEHPAILPLYQVGEAAGQPYFTMKLAVGGTLAQRLSADRPWSALRAAELTVVLADALQYAHMHGVIHRDLKPGNILFDEAGRPYLADFGLAKLEDALATFTRSAGVLGTPAYLAPEIASSGARAATTASDIYSLGAVFFELLTGRPPFAVEGLAALLVKIAEEAPPTPTSLNAQIPRDLEIVCLKCLRKSATDRYPTAAEFAADLHRWIRGEPVHARQFTPVERLAKWARRRPAQAGLSAALVATALGSAVWLTHSNHRLNHALRGAEAAQQVAARRAEFYLGSIADRLEALGRLDILNDAYADVLSTETGADDASRSRRARLLTRWGRNLFIQNRHEMAHAPLAEAVLLAQSLPASPENHVLHAEASTARATLIAETGSFEVAVAILTAAEERINRSTSLPPADRHRALAQLAESYTHIGLSTVRTSKEIQEQAARAVTHRRESATLDPGPETRLALASALRQEGETLVREAKSVRPTPPADVRPLWEMARSRFDEALKLAQALMTQTPVAPAWQREEAQNLGWIAVTLAALDPGASDASLALLKDEVRILDEVVNQDPLNWRNLRELASALDNLADAYKQRGDLELEDATRSEQESVVRNLQKLDPAARSWLFVAIDANYKLGVWHLARGRPVLAESQLARAWQSAEKVLAMRPDHLADLREIQRCADGIQQAWSAHQHPEFATRFLENALATNKELATASASPQTFHWLAAYFHRRLADKAALDNDMPRALEHNLNALRLRADALIAQAPPALRDPAAVTHTFLNVEKIHSNLGNIDDVVALANEALELRKKVPDLSLDPNPWANVVVATAGKGVEAGGAAAAKARPLAARALAELFPSDLPASPPLYPPFEPQPEHVERFQNSKASLIRSLKQLAGPEATQAP